MKLKIRKYPFVFFAFFIATFSCKNDEEGKEVQTPAAYQAANIFETADWLFFTFEYQAHRHQGYYDKANNQLQIGSGWTDSGGNKAIDELYYFLK